MNLNDMTIPQLCAVSDLIVRITGEILNHPKWTWTEISNYLINVESDVAFALNTTVLRDAEAAKLQDVETA